MKRINVKLLLLLLLSMIIIIPSFVNVAYGKDIKPEFYIENNILPMEFLNGQVVKHNNSICIPIKQFVTYLGFSLKINKESIIIFKENKQEVLVINKSNLYEKNKIYYIPLKPYLKKLNYRYVISNNDIRIYPMGDNIKPYNKKEYPSPNSFTPFASSKKFLDSSLHFQLDENGVFTYNYGSRYENARRQYNPSFMSSYAFAAYRDFLKTGQRDKKLTVLTQAAWLIKNRVDYGDFSVWEYNFDNNKFNAKAPWRSAMANGRVISVMIEAYALTGETKYLEIAERAYRAFLVGTGDYGLATFLPDGTAFYEEVADPGAISSKVLNGHIFALSGLYDYYRTTGRRDIKIVLDKGINAVKNNLDEYDAGFLSYYSQKPMNPKIFAPRDSYNILHVHQLLWLYNITNESKFLEKAMRFYSYEMFEGDISAKGSVDPEGHGSNNLNLTMGTNYWSHSQFPTWIKAEFEKPRLIEGISLMGYIQKAAPKDINIFTSERGQQWSLIKEVRDNNQQFKTILFSQPIYTKFIKAEILSDNGNENVALTGIGILRPNVYSELAEAITNFENFSISNSPYKVLTQQGNFQIKKDGWIIVNLAKYDSPLNRLKLYTGNELNINSYIEVFASNNLKQWEYKGRYKICDKENIIEFNKAIKANFIKLELPKEILSINQLSFSFTENYLES